MTSEMDSDEKVKVFDLEGKFLGMEDKTKFYKEIRAEYHKTSMQPWTKVHGLIGSVLSY